MSRKIFLRRSLQTPKQSNDPFLLKPFAENLNFEQYNPFDFAAAKKQQKSMWRVFANIAIDIAKQQNELMVNERQSEEKLRSSKEQVLPHRKRKYDEAEWSSTEVQAQQNNTQKVQQHNLIEPVAKIENQQVMRQTKNREIISRRSLGRKCKKVRVNVPVEEGPRSSKRNATKAVASNMVHQCNVCHKTYRKSGFLILHSRRSHPQII